MDIAAILEGTEVARGIAPWVLPAIMGGGALLDFFGGRSQAREQNQFLRDEAAADREFDEFALIQQLLPELSRQQSLDPVRNAVLADIGGEFFPGVDGSVFSDLQARGPRMGLLPAPSFGKDLEGFLRDEGFPAAGAQPGAQPRRTAGAPEQFSRNDGLPPVPAPPPKTGAPGPRAGAIQLPRQLLR